MPATPSAEDPIAWCSFCGKPNTEVHRLVAGPGVHICNECVELAAWVIEEAAHAHPGRRRPAALRTQGGHSVTARPGEQLDA